VNPDLFAGDIGSMRLNSGPLLEMEQGACLRLQAVFWQVVIIEDQLRQSEAILDIWRSSVV
jgi:hypothetical protein